MQCSQREKEWNHTKYSIQTMYENACFSTSSQSGIIFKFFVTIRKQYHSVVLSYFFLLLGSFFLMSLLLIFFLIVVVFSIHSHEPAMGVHVSPILNHPPTPTPHPIPPGCPSALALSTLSYCI